MLHRQQYGKGGPLTCLTFDCQEAVHFLCYIITHRKSQSCPLLLGCVKWIEYFADILFPDAAAGILELYCNHAVTYKTRYRKRPAARHCVNRVEYKVDGDLRQLVGVSDNLRQVLRQHL